MPPKNMKLVDYIPEYEAMTGERVSPVVARFAEQMDTIGQKFVDKGFQDASQGLSVPSNETFQAWGERLFEGDAIMAEAIAGIIRLYYIDGYREGGVDNGKERSSNPSQYGKGQVIQS